MLPAPNLSSMVDACVLALDNLRTFIRVNELPLTEGDAASIEEATYLMEQVQSHLEP